MTLAQETLISASGISVRLQGRVILNEVDLKVQRGQIVTLIGPNGAGKTTLVRAILGLLKPDNGKIDRQPGIRIGYMPQHLHLSENLPLTVRRFLVLGCSKGCERDLLSVAEQLDIGHLLEHPLQRLSGGEHQRVLLARALLRKPDLLVLDEPVQGVDVTGQAALYSLITKIRDHLGCAVLMISHDLHLVMATTDQVFCLNQHVCCSGHPESVSQHPAYLELFGTPASAELAVYTHHHDHTHDINRGVDAEIEEKPHG
jgi:zinc transport system ATP-binding protein